VFEGAQEKRGSPGWNWNDPMLVIDKGAGPTIALQNSDGDHKGAVTQKGVQVAALQDEQEQVRCVLVRDGAGATMTQRGIQVAALKDEQEQVRCVLVDRDGAGATMALQDEVRSVPVRRLQCATIAFEDCSDDLRAAVEQKQIRWQQQELEELIEL